MPLVLNMNLRFLLAIALLTQVVGCASIVSGANQSISVEAKSDSGPVVGANCKLSNNKGTWYVTTPGSTTVQRSFEDLGVTCVKQDHDHQPVAIKSNTKAMAFGNILFGGVIGVGVDVATGAAYDYPAVISVALVRVNAASTQLPSNPPAEAGSVARSQTAAPSAPQSNASKTGGADTYNAERAAKSPSCAAPSASLVEKGPGFEAYSVACQGGELLAIRCEFGNCKASR